MAEGAFPTGTVTFLFTDIEGSTRLLQELGRDRYGDIQDQHAKLIRAAIATGDGTVIRTEGDSFFVAFPTPSGALRAAVEAQRSLAAERWSHGEPLRVRMGMHTGEGYLGGDDYLGIDVNRAARIGAAGHGGQVVLSVATRSLVEHDLPAGVSLRDLGSHRLKDIPHPERLCDLVIEGVRSEFPPLKTADARAHNLPVIRTSFVGRAGEIRALAELIRPGALVTLTGPGGTGKTRLAVRLAEEVLSDFPDGAFFVDLSLLRDPGLVPSTIAQTLRLKEDPERSLVLVVKDFLAEREVLLMLDNFEQVAEAAPAVDEIVAAADRSTVVVTSRIRLGLAGEHEFSVSPLDPPDPGVSDPRALSRSEAVVLFVDRARAARNDFVLSHGNASAVAEICAKVDGLPLAVELAAVQVRLLTPQEIVSRLDSRLGALGAGPRNLPERQRTLRRTIEWSHDLLSPVGRTLFARLSVFAAGAALEAVEAVCNPAGDLGGDTLEALATLVGHSLVRRVEVPEGSRFTMLESIREFALERLGESGEADELRDRHGDYFVRVGEVAEPHLTETDRDLWLDRLEWDHGNLRAVTEWAIEGDRGELGLRNVASLWRLFLFRGHVSAGRQVVAAVLALPSAAAATRPRARALLALGSLAYWQDDMVSARGSYREALDLARKLGDREVEAEALFDLAYVEGVDGDFDAAQRLFRQTAEIREMLGDRRGRAWVDVGMAMVLGLQGRWDEIVGLLDEALPTLREVGDLFGVENATGAIATAEYRLGHLDRAEELVRQSLEPLPRRSPGAAVGLAGMATLALARGDPVRAMRLWGAFEAIQEELGGGAPMALLPLGDTREDAAARLGEEAAARAREEGRRMGHEEAVRYALGEE
ncbi:MAG: ATP-binding protein [Actinomycetota bacterium]